MKLHSRRLGLAAAVVIMVTPQSSVSMQQHRMRRPTETVRSRSRNA